MYNNDYTTMNKKDIYTILEKIGLPTAEATVYMALLDGVESAAEIIKITGEKRPTVYYSLNSLMKRGLVSKTGKEYGNTFQVAPMETLEEIVNRNIREQTVLLHETQKLKELYPKNKKAEKTLVSYFDSFDAIKTAIFYSLYAKEKTIRSIVPGNHFFLEVGPAFMEEYVSEKKKRKIKTIALWEDIPKRSVLEEFYKDSDIRQLPVEMHNSFETTIFIYDNKTLYISPKKENHAVLIQSNAHAKTMRALFDAVWRSGISVI
jgi:sugar-specific transcriptional regulator TrmB